MLRVLMEKVDNKKETDLYVSREIETLRKNWKEMLEIKNTGTEMKNASDGLINRLDIAKDRICKF